MHKKPKTHNASSGNVQLVQLNQKLSRLIADKNLTQEQLGEALGIAHTTVGRWLSGKSKPYPRIAQRLANYFAIPIETLLNDDIDLPSVAAEKQVAAQLGLVTDSYGNMHIADPEAPEIAWRESILKDIEAAREKITEAQETLDNLIRVLAPPDMKRKSQRKI